MTDDEPAAPRPLGRRRQARLRALRILYGADVRGEDPTVLLAEARTDPEVRRLLDAAGEDTAEGDPPPIDPFTATLVEGVARHRADIDALLDRYAHGWPVRRMPVVDRNLLRMAVFELRHLDTPAAVVIDEAVELARLLSTDDSPRFVHGLLAAIQRDLGRADSPPPPPSGTLPPTL